MNPSTLTFTPSNWNVEQTVTVSLPDDAENNPEEILLLCGALPDANGHAAFTSCEAGSASVTVTPVENDIAATVASETFTYEPTSISYAVSLSGFGSQNGIAAHAATVTLVVSDAAGARVATTNATLSQLVQTLSLSVGGLSRATRYRAVATVRTFPDVARTIEIFAATPLAPAEELVDLMDDEAIRGTNYFSNASNRGVQAWDNGTRTWDPRFGGYSNPNWFVYHFTTPQIVNGIGIEGCEDGDLSTPANEISLYGSNTTNANDWVLLLDVCGEKDWGVGEWRRFQSTNETAYSYYKVAVDNTTFTWVRIQEAELYSIASLLPGGSAPPVQIAKPVIGGLGAIRNAGGGSAGGSSERGFAVNVRATQRNVFYTAFVSETLAGTFVAQADSVPGNGQAMTVDIPVGDRPSMFVQLVATSEPFAAGAPLPASGN